MAEHSTSKDTLCSSLLIRRYYLTRNLLQCELIAAHLNDRLTTQGRIERACLGNQTPDLLLE